MQEQISKEVTASTQGVRKPYVRPQIEVVGMQSESLLQTASGNAGTIGQGSAGGSGSPAPPPAGGGGAGYTPYVPWGD